MTRESPRIIVALDEEFDGGYPSSVENDDGTIVTAYYSVGVSMHQRYHMGVCPMDTRLNFKTWLL